jgi:hypothetical protein
MRKKMNVRRRTFEIAKIKFVRRTPMRRHHCTVTDCRSSAECPVT